MYPVSSEYQNKIKENNRLFKARIQINHSTGVLNLTDEDLVLGSLLYSEGSQAGEEFTVGGTVASDLSFSIMNKPEYEGISFTGARVTTTVNLLLREGADAHFLQPSQPSKMLDNDDLWENVPLGRFNIDDVKRLRNTIELKAIDDMIKLDIPYSLSKLSYPANLYQIYVNICNVADVQIGTVDFPNKNHVVTNRPGDDLTLRDVLGYVAELSGTFAKFNRLGQLELKWYTQTDIEIEPSNRFDFKPSDDTVQIKGVMATVGDTVFLAGTEDYAIDLTDNPLLQSGYETVLPAIFNNIKDTVFTPYISGWQGNPAIQVGDMVTHKDRDGKIYNTLVTRSVYKYRGRSTLEARGLPEIARGFKGGTDRRIAQIKRIVNEEVGDKLTTLEQAQLNATEMLANMLGGHIIEDKPNGILYIADNPNINLAVKVWKYGINGFGYSSTGVNGIYTTAVTADGSIVAMLISANIITANMVQTGILSSEAGDSWFNLDTGVLRISHGGTEYSQMDINGFSRKYANGNVGYLNDIYIEQFNNIGASASMTPPIYRVYLPSTFFQRPNTEIFVIPNDRGIDSGFMNSSGVVTEIAIRYQNIVKIHGTWSGSNFIRSSNFNVNPPWVDVQAGRPTEIAKNVGGTRQFESKTLSTDFVLIAIGV